MIKRHILPGDPHDTQYFTQPSRDDCDDTKEAIYKCLKKVEDKHLFSERHSLFKRTRCCFHTVSGRTNNAKACTCMYEHARNNVSIARITHVAPGPS